MQLLKGLVLWSCIGNYAFAVCEHERSEYKEFYDLHEKLCAASQVCNIAGNALGIGFAIPTFGLSFVLGGLVGGVPGLAVHNARRIRDEKKVNLDRCEALAEQERQARQNQLQLDLAAQQQREVRVDTVQKKYDQQMIQAGTQYRDAVQPLIQGMVDEGIDTTLPEAIEVIAGAKNDLTTALNRQLEEINSHRRSELDQASL